MSKEFWTYLLILIFISIPVYQNCSNQDFKTNKGANLPVPLEVSHDSHVVVMGYETWWGPNARHFEGLPATPLLTSQSMQALGLKGYDSQTLML